MDKKLTGRWGEQLAAEYLKKKHWRILGLNYTTRFGEIDVIAATRRYIVFAEVKLRKSSDYGEAREYVTRSKQEKLIKTAAMYLAANPTELQPRFDVIEIYAPEGEKTKNPTIIHIENAFQ